MPPTRRTPLDTPALATDRLDLRPLSLAAVEALVAGDAARLREATGARFPADPVPALMADALPALLDLARSGPVAGWSTPWLLRRRADGAAVGFAGFAGGPDGAGAVLLGYGLYPEAEGRGYATEAARALVAWALAQPGVSRVRATIPPDHARSRRVADKAGMGVVGTAHDDEVGEVLVYEVTRDGLPG